ncbi:MAG: putative Rossmann-fold nucleotide-binding protein [Verrucomicrobiales bacterium]
MTTTSKSSNRASPLIPECGEITSLAAFGELLIGSASKRALAIQGLDLREFTDELIARPWPHTVFLGCQMSPEAEAHVAQSGATIFPTFDGLPYNPYRGALYTSDELRTHDLDGRIYHHQARWRAEPPAPIIEALAQRIHDHAIDDALHAYLLNHPKVVAIMGGHSLHRDHATYRTVAVVARALTRVGHLVVTGGGPGAMEAGNLGAWLAPHEDRALDDAIEMLSSAVDFSTAEYGKASISVVEAFPGGAESLAIPTWFYGHEPTNDFATAVAKYFSNSIREDGLLAIATHGVVYTPGAAGTVQEVFMDATQNHYNVFGIISPMVFVDSAYWADDRLAAPLLLRQLAGERPYADLIAVLDEPEEVVDFITSHPPIRS